MAKIVKIELYHFGEYAQAIYTYDNGTVEKETFRDWIK